MGVSGDDEHSINDALKNLTRDTGAAYHMTDLLDCMRDVEPCSMTMKGIEGKVRVAEAMGTLTVVFINGDQEFIADLHDVMYVSKLGDALFSADAEFDGERWDRIGDPDGVMTAFGKRVNLHSRGGMLVTTGTK